jgi:hypothetical protein
MSPEEYSEAFTKLRNMRFDRLAAGYQVQTPDGPVNAGYFRDNVLDLLEELGDVLNITELLVGRVSREGTDFTLAIAAALQGVLEGVSTSLDGLYNLDQQLPAPYRQETAKRDVTREEAGFSR